MSNEITIEQPASLNQYLYAQPSWTSRWRLVGFCFPMGFGLVIMSLGVAWLDNELQKVSWPAMIFLCLIFPIGGISIYEINGWARLARVKKLQLDSSHVQISPLIKIPWSEICRFSFSRLTDNPNLIRLDLDYRTTLRRRKIESRWHMVLETKQKETLQKAVAQFGQADKIKTELEASGVRPGEIPREYSWIMWCFMTALLQFPFGLGFLVGALFPESASRQPGSGKSFPHENLIIHFLVKYLHIRTPEMFRLFCGLVGAAVLIGSAILFYISWAAANRIQNSRQHPDEI